MRILYINLGFAPQSGPGVWRALAMAKYLPRFGVHPHVLCADRAPGKGAFDTSLLDDVPSSVRVQHLSSVYQNEAVAPLQRLARALPGAAGELTDKIGRRLIHEFPDQQAHWAMKVVLHGTRLALSNKVAAMVTSGPPHIAHVAGLMIRRASGIPWIVDYRDLWTDDPVQTKQTSYQQQFFEKRERAVIETADRVVAVSPGYVQHLQQRFSGKRPDSSYRLIRNGHDLDDVQVDAAHEPPSNERLHIHFNGTPQVTHPFLHFVQAFLRLRQQGRRLPLFTCTKMPAEFRKAVDQNGLQDAIKDVGRMSRADCIRYAMGCDVLVAMVNRDNPLYRGTIPGKAYEAIALGRHLLGVLPVDTVVRDLVSDPSDATFVDVDSIDSVCGGIVEIMARFESKTLHQRRGLAEHRRRAAVYHRAKQAGELAALLREIAP